MHSNIQLETDLKHYNIGLKILKRKKNILTFNLDLKWVQKNGLNAHRPFMGVLKIFQEDINAFVSLDLFQ